MLYGCYAISLLFQLSHQHKAALSPCAVTQPLIIRAPSEQELQLTNQQTSQELLRVFGNTSLWARTLQYQSNIKKKLGGKSKAKHKATKQNTVDPISASINTITSLLPFPNDINLGSNSTEDVYIQFLTKKNWIFRHNFSLDTQQLFRYGSSSKNYAETSINLNQKIQDNTLFSNQFSLNKSSDDNYYWENRAFQQLDILKNQRLVYGLYSSGIYDEATKEWELQLWGPYLSWRRPLWRNWIFINNQISYYHDRTTTEKELQRVFSATVQFEANF